MVYRLIRGDTLNNKGMQKKKEDDQDRLIERQIYRRRKRKKEIKKEKQRKRFMLIVVLTIIIAVVVLMISSCINNMIKDLKSDDDSKSDIHSSNNNSSSTLAIDDIPDNGENGYFIKEGIFIWNNKAFETFEASENAAKAYAGAISHYKNKLGNDINVYNLVVPTHTAFGLPDRLEKTIPSTNQKKYLDEVFSGYSSKVKPVNVYDIFEEKKKEYIYLNTDHRWTALGAYYAYKEFCEVANESPVDISSLTSNNISNFTGTLYSTSRAEVLNNNPDTITYYDMPESYTMSILKKNSSQWKEYRSVYNEDISNYDLFIYGDNSVTQIINDDEKNGKNILVVKDSYGNAFVPWLVNNYDKVHSIDFRSYNGNIISYCAKNEITDVLFINSTVNSSVSTQVDKMSALFA